MGLVYETEHVRLGRKAALKVLDPSLASDETFRARFVEESRLVAAIEHPNIIPIYDADEVNGTLYIAMRYVDGEDLRTLITKTGRLTAESALTIVGQAAAALDAAHARDLVHRDVKPANILIDEVATTVFLTDFGVAQRAGATDEADAGLLVGTVDYAPPEQLEGKQVTASVDVYALTAVLYECLTGTRPFEKETDVAVVYAHLLDPPPSVTTVRSDVPAAIDLVVATGMAKNPDQRYRTAGELLAAARQAVSVEPREAAVSVAVPIRPVDRVSPAAALPIPSNPLLGRDREVRQLAELLRSPDVRAVSVVGAGGSGKTRLAIEVALRLEAEFRDGVVFVPLAAVAAADGVAAAMTEALAVEERLSPAEDERENLVRVLAGRLSRRQLLLVLDNFEHVLPAASLLSDLLRQAPGFKLLVTSQAALRIQGERELPVPPLQLPAEEAVDTETVARSPAVALFVQTAQATRPDFHLTDDNAGAVAAVCARLDGLPLAIELAAARIKVLTPEAMVKRLENRLALLTSAGRDRPSRHQTLRGTIEWSFGLLDPQAQAFFSRLAVFEGGFTADAADAVGAPATDVLAALESLVDKSLLVCGESGAGETRFALLETIQEYGRYRLIESAELDETRRRHADYYLQLTELAEPELLGPDQTPWLRRLEEESGNIRAAVAWALDADVVAALRIAGALTRFWSVRGHMSEGRGWLRRALASDDGIPTLVRAKGLFAAGYAALGQGDYDHAIECFDQALALYRTAHDASGAAASLAQLGWLLTARADHMRAVDLSKESLSLARSIGDARTESVALSNLAEQAQREGDIDRAAHLFQEALALRRDLGDRRNIANALLNLARVELLRGADERATALLDEGLDLSTQVHDSWGTSVALIALALVALRRGDPRRASQLLEKVVPVCHARGDKRVAAECLVGVAAVTAERDPAGAALLLGAADSLRETMGVPLSPVEELFQEARLAGVLHDGFASEREAGRALRFDDALQKASDACSEDDAYSKPAPRA